MENNKNEILIWEAPELIETTFEETEGGRSAEFYEGANYYDIMAIGS